MPSLENWGGGLRVYDMYTRSSPCYVHFNERCRRKEGRKKQARPYKQQSKATQHCLGWDLNLHTVGYFALYTKRYTCTCTLCKHIHTWYRTCLWNLPNSLRRCSMPYTSAMGVLGWASRIWELTDSRLATCTCTWLYMYIRVLWVVQNNYYTQERKKKAKQMHVHINSRTLNYKTELQNCWIIELIWLQWSCTLYMYMYMYMSSRALTSAYWGLSNL